MSKSSSKCSIGFEEASLVSSSSSYERSSASRLAFEAWDISVGGGEKPLLRVLLAGLVALADTVPPWRTDIEVGGSVLNWTTGAGIAAIAAGGSAALGMRTGAGMAAELLDRARATSADRCKPLAATRCALSRLIGRSMACGRCTSFVPLLARGSAGRI